MIKKKYIIDLYFIISTILFTGAVISLGGEILGTASLEGDPFQLLVYLMIYIIMVPLVLANFNYIVSIVKREKIIAFIIILCFISVLWSDLPQITLRRSIAILLTTTYAIMLTYYYNLKGFLNILSNSMIFIVIISFIVSLIIPEIGIHQSGLHEGRWRGIFLQKNMLTIVMALSLLLFLYKYYTSKYRLKYIILIAICLFLMIQAGGTTAVLSLLIVTVSLMFYWVYLNYEKKSYIFYNIITLIMVIIPSALFFINIESIFELFDKDITLTGRVPLWILLLEQASNKPILGFGFESFWSENSNAYASVVNQLFWEPKNSHNGYIEIILNIGLIGLMSVVLKFIINFMLLKEKYNKNNKIYIKIISLLLFYIIIVNITESLFLGPNSIYWIIFVCLSIYIKKGIYGKT